MSKQLTPAEEEKILALCINNKEKACAIAQHFVDCLQLMPVADYARIKGKSKRTVLYQASKLNGVKINKRKFLSL